ncbi:hypothetical protein [Rubrivirga sp. IMCC45206]|uniref:hypothetical protein n=1 Tax=Rubrivirga sp. IMCC45206 TaxID=3391614 RepID=UPI0039903041
MLALAACATPPPTDAALLAPALPTVAAEPGPTTGTIAFEDSVHALAVFVRFPDDTADAAEWPIREADGAERVPDWGETLLVADADAVGRLPRSDGSLSAYFWWQSRGGPAGPHVLSGEVWPRVDGRPATFVPSKSSTGYRGGGASGYGWLVAELFDTLVADPAFDITRFDANRDGELDHLMLIVRRDPGVRVMGGVANLSGVDSRAARTYGRPAAALAFQRGGTTITVDLGTRGSGAISWVGGEYALGTLGHEYGHILFDIGHTPMITPPAFRSAVSNDVPADVPEATGAFACQYNRMCGGGASNGVPYESSTYDGTPTLGGYELRRQGWANRIVLDASRDTAGVRLRPLYGTGDVAVVGLAPGSGADTLSLEVRRRDNPFDARAPLDLGDPYYGLVYRDLPAEGLLATLTWGEPSGPWGAYLFDWMPPSNALAPGGSRCDGTSPGCTPPYGARAGDMWGRGASQITPWTRPNVSGYTLYPQGTAPNWFGITQIRDHADGSMSFDLVADVRRQPVVEIAVDSWMGAETSGTTFRQPVRVAAGATLTVWQGATVTFAGGLDVAPGGRCVCEPGATCVR